MYMAHKKNTPNGGFSEVLFSLWDGDKMIVGWKRSKQEVRAALVRSGHKRGKMFTLKAQTFFTPPRE